MPKESLDKTDLRILDELQNDARITNVELARRVNLSPSPCLARVRALEEAGVIRRHVTLLSPQALDLNLNVFIHVSMDRQVRTNLDRFEAAARAFPQVLECYLMTGSSDYLLRVTVGNVEELEHFIVEELSQLEGVANIQSSVALKQVKYTTALPLYPTAPAGGQR